MPARPSKTARAKLELEIESVAKLSSRERALLALRLGRFLARLRKRGAGSGA